MNVSLPALPILLAYTFAFSSLNAQNIQVSRDNKTIAITATDSAEADADTAEITIGFILYGSDQQKTYADATVISNHIIDTLTSAKVLRDHIRSASQNLSTIDNEDKLRYTQGIRFLFSQSWKVTVRAADADAILHAAITAGANQSGAIEWKLEDDNALQAQAAAKALNHAHQIAESMAGGLHAKLGPLVYASNQQPQRFGYVLQTESASLNAVRFRNLKPLAILPDRVLRSATVYAVFELD